MKKLVGLLSAMLIATLFANITFAQQTKFKYTYPSSESQIINSGLSLSGDSLIFVLSSLNYCDTNLHSDCLADVTLFFLNNAGQKIGEQKYSKADTAIYITSLDRIDNELFIMGNLRDNRRDRYMGYIACISMTDYGITDEIIIANDTMVFDDFRIRRIPDSSFVAMSKAINLSPTSRYSRYTSIMKIAGNKKLRSVKYFPPLNEFFSDFRDFDIRTDTPRFAILHHSGLYMLDTSLVSGYNLSSIALQHLSTSYRGNILKRSNNDYLILSRGGYTDGTSNFNDMVFYRQLNRFRSVPNFTVVPFPLGYSNHPPARNIDTTSRGEVYCASSAWADVSRPPYYSDTSFIRLVKFDSSYRQLWVRRYGDDACYFLQGIFATNDGGCLMYGSRYDLNIIPKCDGYILKVDGNGAVVSETSIPMVTPRIVVFPNPSSEFLTIDLPSLSGEIDVRVFDAQGKLVLSEKGRNAEKSLNIQELASGNYVLQVWQKGQLLGVAQWVKY
jgi:hypothetical protein